MIRMEPVRLSEEHHAVSIEAKLPDTNFLIVTTAKGYIMCGALDIGILDQKRPERDIVAGRALGVRSITELLDAPLESVTKAAEDVGIQKGMTGKEAVIKMME